MKSSPSEFSPIRSRRPWRCLVPLVCSIAILMIGGGQLSADEPTFLQLAQQKRIERDLDLVGQLLAAEKPADAAAIWGRAYQRIDQLSAGQNARSMAWALETLDRAAVLRERCVEAGQAVDEAERLRTMLTRIRQLPPRMVTSEPEKPTESKPPVAINNMPAEMATVSFSSQVAPILMEKCGRCHVARRQGRFSLATYESLMNKADAVHAGDPSTSELIELIESGEMPKGGLTVDDAELAILKAWIAQGAKCDDADRLKSLASLVEDNPPSAAATETTKPMEVSTSEIVSFSKQIAPIFIDNCAGCHMDGRRLRGGLNLATFESMRGGGDSGPIVVPGNGEDSLLTKKLRGTGGGMQMPVGTGPLDEGTIQLVSTWISQGAKFDGFSESGNIRDVLARARAADSTHEQLSTEREQRAIANWKLVMGGKDPVVQTTDNLIILGPDDSADLARFAQVADSVIDKVSSQLKLPSREPFIKGKIAAYVFQVRYDYSEFGKMVERRDLPKDISSHWGNDSLDAFIAAQLRPADYDQMKPVLAQHLTAIYIRGLAADVPGWFADGYGYWIADRAYSGDDLVKMWEQKSKQLVQSSASPDDFLQGRLTDDDAGLVGYQFIQFLKAGGSNQFNKLLRDLRDHNSFDRSFNVNFGKSPAEFVGANQTGGGR